MVPRILARSSWSGAALLLFTAMPAVAGPIVLTGNVEHDFPTGGTGIAVVADVNLGKASLQQALVDKGFVSGWGIKDIRLSYDKTTDIMSVGVNNYGIAGDADGNGDPGGADPYTVQHYGNDKPNFGGTKSITVAFAASSTTDPLKTGNPVIVAGIPSVKAAGTTGIANYQVARFAPGEDPTMADKGLAYDYGTKLTSNTGALAFNPSKDHPNFEFFIANFSKIPGLDPTKPLWLSVFSGSGDGKVSGEIAAGGLRVPDTLSQQTVPEPASLLAWGAILAGVGVYARGRVARVKPQTGS